MRHFAILIFLMAKIGSGIAQDIQSPLPPRTMHEGYVISSGGDTIQGYIMFKTAIANQFNVSLFGQMTDRKPLANYKPKDLKCYRVGEIQYVTVPFSGKGFSRNKSFMIRLSKGPVSLYQWYYDESLMIDSQDINAATGQEEVLSIDLDEGIVIQYFGVRNNEKPVDFSSVKYGMNFKKQMSRYVSDYPELAEKIASKQPGYGYYDLTAIIDEYNEWLLK